MKGIEKDLLKMSVSALKRAYNEINSLKCDFAVDTVVGGKFDTYGLDFIPEEAIIQEVGSYDPNIVLITEETGKNYSGETGLEPTQTVLICDPTDRSIKMREFLQAVMEEDPSYSEKLVHEAFKVFEEKWTKENGDIVISGASASITAIRDRRIIFNVMTNYITGELFIADALGTKKGSIMEYGKKEMDYIEFPSSGKKTQKFVTFLKKPGYQENLEQCNIGFREEDDIDPWTGGPLRILRLSSLDNDDISFILSNGEKICEWIGWLSWVKYARDPVQSDEHALEAYRMSFESPRTRERVSVAPADHYSIFVTEDGETRVNLDRMFQLPDPSHYRETILVTPRHNITAASRVKSLGNTLMQL